MKWSAPVTSSSDEPGPVSRADALADQPAPEAPGAA
jgi:hypothetical protein